MTKAAVCVACSDIVAPHRDWQTDRRWRWCECTRTGVRWVDGTRGLLEVTSAHGPDGVRVLGLHNTFLEAAVQGHWAPEEWQQLHIEATTLVDRHYLFHADRRACWALVVRVGDTGDVAFVPYTDAVGDGVGIDLRPTQPNHMSTQDGVT